MNPNLPDDAWLDGLLAQTVAPLPDDGFSARVMARVDALGSTAASAAAAAAAPCVPPTAALSRLAAVTRRERRRQAWTTGGVLAAAGIGLLTLWAQPSPQAMLALVPAAAALPWLLLRDPRF